MYWSLESYFLFKEEPVYLLRKSLLCSWPGTVYFICVCVYGFPGGTVVKNPPANAGDARDAGLIPGLGRSPGRGHGNRLQYSCLGNPMDGGAWRAAVHGVSKSRTWLSTHIVRHPSLRYRQSRALPEKDFWGCEWSLFELPCPGCYLNSGIASYHSSNTISELCHANPVVELSHFLNFSENSLI